MFFHQFVSLIFREYFLSGAVEKETNFLLVQNNKYVLVKIFCRFEIRNIGETIWWICYRFNCIHNKFNDYFSFFTAITERGVGVRLMLSERAYTYKHRKEHLQSLLELNKDLKKNLVQIKVFHVSQFCSTINNSQLVT